MTLHLGRIWESISTPSGLPSGIWRRKAGTESRNESMLYAELNSTQSAAILQHHQSSYPLPSLRYTMYADHIPCDNLVIPVLEIPVL